MQRQRATGLRRRPASMWIGARPRRLRVEPLEPRELLSAVRFAVIGDYGSDGANEAAVAGLVKSWSPEFVVTVGDNNYPAGAADTIDQNIGKHYHEFIGNYQGAFGQGSDVNRFFPAIGDREWATQVAGLPQPYLDYFTLPGNELYYDFVWGPAHFFILDSYVDTPDGAAADSLQAQWLETTMGGSASPWNIVVIHEPPYSSGSVHGSEPRSRWPFKQWGADLVISGNDHVYERLLIDSAPYVLNGLGGRSLYSFGSIVPGSEARYSSTYGAMLVEGDEQELTFKELSLNAGGQVVDSFRLRALSSMEESLVARQSVWKYLDNGSNQGSAWKEPGFADAAWASGPAKLGYGLANVATSVSFGGNPSNRFVTTYFRQTFQVSDPLAISELALRMQVDDGAVAYLNGQEVVRHNMPGTPIAVGTLASFAVDAGEDSSWSQFFIDPALLLPGANVLAVEVHQSAVNSSDLGFDLELVGIHGGPPVSVVGRRIFYNNSSWDGNDATANAQDDAAIATDKSALLPGGAATLVNYTSFSKGINGIMLDVQNLAGTITAADFAFKTGNVNDTSTWTALATVPSVSVRPGAGAGGSTRVTLTWPDGTIKKQWLQVKMLANGNTGLPADDAFYFGNAVGEAGNSAIDAQVNAADELAARGNPRNIANPAPITFLYDYNRDKQVNAADQLLSRGNPTNLASRLLLITPTSAAEAAAPRGQAPRLADAALVAVEYGDEPLARRARKC